MAATMHAKIHRRKLDKLNIIKTCIDMDNSVVPSYNELMSDFEDAVLKQRSSFLPGSRLSDLNESRLPNSASVN
ncbi:hypothetical protein CASFOL_030925 [Castilleja foliolosa]|uniref:Uncharacterized protein n=1 Tax=Castilleja foliolosa TaxID=1961234 RepID=A0ABD3C809_9LAMI